MTRKNNDEKVLVEAGIAGVQSDDIIDGFNVDEDVELMKALSLSKEIKTSILEVGNVGRQEIKTLVDLFYQMQDIRKALREQIRSIEHDADEGSSINVMILEWNLKNIGIIENGIKKCLELVCQSDPVGRWLLSIVGMGPILSAGLLAYLDVTGKNYASNFISYAGLNDNNRPWLGAEKSKNLVNEVVGTAKTITDDMVVEIAAKSKWSYDYLRDNAYNQEKGKWSKTDLIKACSKIPYNKKLKTLLYKCGSSWQWCCNKPNSLYGQLFNQRRVYETIKNENGDYAAEAAKQLACKNFSKTTEAYKQYSQGKLPKAHITMRAMRWTEKIFLSHLFEEMYRVKYDKVPARYYALEHVQGHHDEILPEVPYTKVTGENDVKVASSDGEYEAYVGAFFEGKK